MGRKHAKKHARRSGCCRESFHAASISSAEVEGSTRLGGSPIHEVNSTYFRLSVFAKHDPFVLVHYAQTSEDIEAQHSSESKVWSSPPRFHFSPVVTMTGTIIYLCLSVILWLLQLSLWCLQCIVAL